MMKRFSPATLSLALATIGLLSTSAYAQQYPAGSQTVVVIGEPARHATSSRECTLRGQADVIRSIGLYNLWNSQAEYNRQQILSRQLQEHRSQQQQFAAQQQEMKRVERVQQAQRRDQRLREQRNNVAAR